MIREFRAWEPALVALATLPDRNGALSRIRTLAGDEILDHSIRIKAARTLVELGDRDTSTRILTLMATASAPLPQPEVETEDDPDFDVESIPRIHQAFEVAWYRWQLGDMDITDAYYSGYIDISDGEEIFEKAPDAHINNRARSGANELKYWLASRREAAWELASLGEARTASDMLVALAADEANYLADESSFNGVSGLPIEWSITNARSSNQILSAIAADSNVSARARLSTAVRIAMNKEAAVLAFSCFQLLAEDGSIDPLVRIVAAGELARSREADDGIRILREIARDANLDYKARLNASDQLIALGKIDPGRSGLYALAISNDAEVESRIAAAEKLARYGWPETGVDVLIHIISNDEIDIESRCESIRQLAGIEDSDIVPWALDSLVQDNSLDPECRIVAARYLI